MQDVSTTAALQTGPSTEVAEIMRAGFAERHGALVRRRDDLLQSLGRVPATVEDEQTAKNVGDFVKQIDAGRKAAEGARVAEKEVYLEGGRTVDGYFKTITEPLEKAKKDITARLNVYLIAKAAEERKEREAAEAKAREESKRLADEAEAKAQAAADAKGLDDAVAAEEAAKAAAAAAETAQREADAKPAELSRTRGDYGSVASLRTIWTFKDMDRAELDLEYLRQHIPTDALEKAVRSFIKAGGRELPGVTIFEDTTTVVR